jgi:hypothetical protein
MYSCSSGGANRSSLRVGEGPGMGEGTELGSGAGMELELGAGTELGSGVGKELELGAGAQWPQVRGVAVDQAGTPLACW